MRRSLSDTLKPPVIWLREGTGDPEGPGCMLNNFPAIRRGRKNNQLISVECREMYISG